MLPIKFGALLHRYRSRSRINLVSSRPIQIRVITVVILGILPFMLLMIMTTTSVHAYKNMKNSSFSLIQMRSSSHYLPSDTETEPRHLQQDVVTKGESKSGTTSTVRPWPSHSFFRAVLSKSDNVVTKRSRKNRSKPSTRSKFNETGIPTRTATERKNIGIKMGKNKKAGNSTTTTKAYRLVTETPPESGGNNERKFSSPELQTLEELASESGVNQKSTLLNVTGADQSEEGFDSTQTANKSSRINSPQVGFQYEILLPSALSSPFPTAAALFPQFELTTSLNHYYTNSSGDSNARNSSSSAAPPDNDGFNENNRNTSKSTSTATSPVSENEIKEKKVTNDGTTTTTSTPFPLGSQLEVGKNVGEIAASTLSTLLQPTSSVSPWNSSGSSNKSSEIILQAAQSPLLALPPTHPLQLDTQLVVASKNGSNGNAAERATSTNKSHLPERMTGGLGNGSWLETHVQIKKNDLFPINHTSGINADTTNKNQALVSFHEASTFSPVFNKTDKQKVSSANTLTTRIQDPFIATTFPSFSSPITTNATTTTSMPPTQFSILSANPTSKQPERKRIQTTTGKHWDNQHTFHKRISQHVSDDQQKDISSANANYPFIHYHRLVELGNVMKSQTALINRRNMFTVVKAPLTNPIRIHVEGINSTKSGLEQQLITTVKNPVPEDSFDTLLHDRTNQVERPSLTTSILAGPDNMMPLASVSVGGGEVLKDNDYFDEDTAQANLHHWIETEQGHFVTPSTELPRFTNLTWPYYIPSGSGTFSSSNSTGESNDSNHKIASGLPSTALSVSFNSKRKGKPNFEFYIPSAAADPNQNPILLGKKPGNKVTTSSADFTPSSFESWTRVPTIQQAASTTAQQLVGNSLKHSSSSTDDDHKSKIKHSHWGSKGLSSRKPGNSEKVKTPVSQNQIKVYESSTGSPKSTTAAFSPVTFSRAPAATTTFTLLSNKQKDQHQKQFVLTSPSSLFGAGGSSSWPFGDATAANGALGHTETASFVTPKTPTNIWYKPIINHFTASLPFSGNKSLSNFDNDQVLKNGLGAISNSGGYVPTTMQYPTSVVTMKRKGYVGDGIDKGDDGNDDDGVSSTMSSFNINKNGKPQVSGNLVTSGGIGRRNVSHTENGGGNDRTNPILFKVWNLADGKLKLENEREIPAWALQGYLIPSSGTILNLQQIPAALQPLVSSAMATGTDKGTTEVQLGAEDSSSLSYVWKPLPIRGTLEKSTEFGKISTTHYTTTTTAAAPRDESWLDNNEFNRIKTDKGWHAETTTERIPAEEQQHQQNGNSNKQPISINYVLWNNPASIYGQSIILSTPSPQTLLSHQPTPVAYFPSSTITSSSMENTPQHHQFPNNLVTIKHPGSITNYVTTTTTQRTSTPSSTVDQEKLELLFQNYFQYFITTSTPAPTTTTTTTASTVANKESFDQDPDRAKVWKDLKELILKLDPKTPNTPDTKASATPDKEQSSDLDYLGNVAAVALIMTYLRNQYEKNSGSASAPFSTKPALSSPAPYGVTDDMTPPNKDQLWATVYPLFQHFLNNPNYTFVPPPPPRQSSSQLLSPSDTTFTTLSMIGSSIPPTSPGPILFTEPQTTATGTSNYYSPTNTEYNHFASYYPTITAPPRTSSSKATHIIITEVPKRGATTRRPSKIAAAASRSEEDQVDDFDSTYDSDWDTTTSTTQRPKTRLLFKKKKKKKKDPVKKAVALLAGASLLKKISGPIFGMVKKPKKYWLDLKFEVDFLDLLKKKMLFMLAYKYLPVAMILAFGVAPVILSLVPLLYKYFWLKWKKPKFIKVPVHVPKPYPVPVYHHPRPRPPPPHHRHHHPLFNGRHQHHQQSFFPPDTTRFMQRPPPPPSPPEEIRYENEHQGHHQNNDVIHVDSPAHHQTPPLILDHHQFYNGVAPAADIMLADGSQENVQLPEHGSGGDQPAGILNSFNYDYVRHSTPDASATHAENGVSQYPYNHYSNGRYPMEQQHQEENQEIHVHLHDEEESQQHPQFQQTPATYSPADGYTSYTDKDLQPYPVTKGYEMGFGLGQTLAGMTNKHDMEIFKILMETKKEKLNKLLEMWNLAKYGAAVASEAAANVIRGPTTPGYGEGKKKKRKKRKRKRKRRKKRKHSGDDNDNVPSINVPVSHDEKKKNALIS